MEILQKNSVSVPMGLLASTPDEVAKNYSALSGKSAVIKAQVLAGGRGRGHFTSGLQGGVKVVNSCVYVFRYFSVVHACEDIN